MIARWYIFKFYYKQVPLLIGIGAHMGRMSISQEIITMERVQNIIMLPVRRYVRRQSKMRSTGTRKLT